MFKILNIISWEIVMGFIIFFLENNLWYFIGVFVCIFKFMDMLKKINIYR